MKPLQLLAIGHVTRDRISDGTLPGGAVVYGGLAAAALGCDVSLYTSYGPDFEHESTIAPLTVHCVPAPTTTTFTNRYVGGLRRQHVAGLAHSLTTAGLPQELAHPDAVLLGPVLGEVDLALAACFPGALVAIGVQGWIRAEGPDGEVLPARWTTGLDHWLPHVDLAVLSDAEAKGQADLLPRLRAAVPRVALTHGARGSTLFTDHETVRIPAVPAQEVDPTGAGDVYVATLLVGLVQGLSPVAAATRASRAAACAVEGAGVSRLDRLRELA